MPPFRFPGPICETRDWFVTFDEGTLARTWSPLPPPLTLSNSAGPQGAPQASGPCSYLNPRSTGTVRAPQAAFDRLRSASGTARISPPQPKASQTWRDGSSSPALEQEIQIDNQRIRVVRPTDADASGKNLPTTAQLAEALRAVPGSQRANTRTVILSPRPHPGSTPSKTIAGDAGGGEIMLFPTNGAQSQNDFDNRVMHESGHNYQGSLWHSAQGVQEWATAAAADQRLPSPYAGENAGEDFSEFGILYNTARGTPCEAAARQLYPNRWTKMSGY
jgi:hypothetical protein